MQVKKSQAMTLIDIITFVLLIDLEIQMDVYNLKKRLNALSVIKLSLNFLFVRIYEFYR